MKQKHTSWRYSFKVIVVGDSGCGKSSLLNQLCRQYFSDIPAPTLGVDFGIWQAKTNSRRLQIWDCSGSERFQSITQAYYRNAEIALCVFDISNAASFESVPRWIYDIRKNVGHDVPILLVPNKRDLSQMRTVSHDAIEAVAIQHNIHMTTEVTSKHLHEVEQLFEQVAQLCPTKPVNADIALESLVRFQAERPSSISEQCLGGCSIQ